MKQQTIKTLIEFASSLQERLIGRCSTSVNIFKDGSMVIIVSGQDEPPVCYTFPSTFEDADIKLMMETAKHDLGL